jgi:hypothetical protein
MEIPPLCSIAWGTVADWAVAVGTLALAAVALFQDAIRERLYHPAFNVTCTGKPPDCVAIPITDLNGRFLADAIYLRVMVENTGKATAKGTEVYAKRLRLRRADGAWDVVNWFPPMNLKWANLGGSPYNHIVPGMSKHCDVGHIVDPARRFFVGEQAPDLGLNNQQTSLAFELIATPNNRTHIVGPGEYELDIQVAAENARPIARTLRISLRGTWDADETKMLRDGVGLSVER